jgi:MFS transporter, FSR family, fosmidomycin resistance protein
MTIRKDAEVIGLISLAHGSSHFFQLILAPLFPWLKVEFGLSYAELGVLMTVFFIVSTFSQAAAGFWVDHSGPFKVLLFGVGALFVSAIFLSLASGYFVLMFGSALAGLGNGIFHPADYTLINRRVSSSRVAHAYSMHGISGALGWAASPAFLVAVTTLVGWRSALHAAAFVIACIFFLLVFRRHILIGSESERAEEANNKKMQSAFSLNFLKLPAVWLCWTFFLLTSLALSGVQSFAPTALRVLYDLPIALTTTAYSTYMLASATGMFIGGFVASRAKFPERIVAIAFMVASFFAVVVGLTIFTGTSTLTIFTLIGFFVGIAGPSRDLMIRKATPKEASGRVFGIVYSGLDLGLAIGPIFFGLIMDLNFEPILFFMIAIFLFLAIFTASRVAQNTPIVEPIIK